MFSCHTATVADYLVEGHVPAADVRRLLAEQPKALGLAIPQMPLGSSGMDFGDERDGYQVGWHHQGLFLLRRELRLEGASPILLGFLGSLAAGMLTSVGALPVLFGRTPGRAFRDMSLGFAAGVMLAASFFSLIIPRSMPRRRVTELARLPPP